MPRSGIRIAVVLGALVVVGAGCANGTHSRASRSTVAAVSAAAAAGTTPGSTPGSAAGSPAGPPAAAPTATVAGVPTSATVAAPTTTSTVPTPVAAPPTTVPVATTTTPPEQITGTVEGPDGHPVPGAVIIDDSSLQVFYADAAGRFTIPYCTAVGQLWVAGWVLPLGTTYAAYYGKPASAGGRTTYFGPPPTTSGPGYARLDRIWAPAATDPAPCQGQAVDARLPAGGTVDITWLRGAGTGAPTAISGPVDGYYEFLPGLPYAAGTYTPTADANGHQVMAQLGAGGMAIDSNSSRFTCAGGGIEATSGSSWQVPVVPGQTAQVTCTVP